MPPHNPRKFARRKLWLVVPEHKVNCWIASDIYNTEQEAVSEVLDLMAAYPGVRWKAQPIWVDIVGAGKGVKK
jgi:hypothetical protein